MRRHRTRIRVTSVVVAAVAALAVAPAAPAVAAGAGEPARAAGRPAAVAGPGGEPVTASVGEPITGPVTGPVAAPQPDPFGGAVPGDVSNGKGALPPAANPPGASPVFFDAIPGTHITQTRFGPIDDTDRLFLINVRWAGLWERPTCLRAQTQAQSPRLKDICTTLASDHTALDAEDRFVAHQLDVGLPDQPNPDQQSWMREFWDMQGHTFDVDAVRWLRFAHGSVFSAIATVRASTRNELMRLLAERADNMVNKHMSLLESTGLVEYDTLPRAGIGAVAAGLANAAVPTLDRQQNRSAADIKRTLAPKNQTLLNPAVIAVLVVSVLLAAVSVRRVVNG